MQEFRDYDILFPELVYDIVDYFRSTNTNKALKDKSILDYCQTSRFSKGKEISGELIQPDVVHQICENLVEKRILIRTKVGLSVAGMDSNYLFSPANEAVFLSKDSVIIFRFNCIAYGFRYIYASYKDHVIPVIVRSSQGNIEMGTCFKFRTGILTAKHCMEASEVAINGFTAERLKHSKVLISNNPNIDLAYIELNEPSDIIGGEAQILDEVLVMGYPKIPTFSDFCAAERAIISSIPTRGAVAAYANQYLSKDIGDLMLVTARIRGGNSGGPVIDSSGAVVGVAFSAPASQGDYDEMGYGIAYPIDVLDLLLNDCKVMHVNYVDNVV